MLSAQALVSGNSSKRSQTRWISPLFQGGKEAAQMCPGGPASAAAGWCSAGVPMLYGGGAVGV